jgi:hypothetical protein
MIVSARTSWAVRSSDSDVLTGAGGVMGVEATTGAGGAIGGAEAAGGGEVIEVEEATGASGAIGVAEAAGAGEAIGVEEATEAAGTAFGSGCGSAAISFGRLGRSRFAMFFFSSR